MKSARGVKKKSNEGQATVEFALTMVLLFAFILFYVQLSLIFAWGNYVHYATFMSARAFLSAGPSMQEQKSRAQDVIIQMLKENGAPGQDKLKIVAKGEGGNSEVLGLSIVSSWMNGVRYTFKSRLFLIPFAGAGKGKDSANSLTLTSESWLGREPTYEECQKDMGKMKGIWDNGC